MNDNFKLVRSPPIFHRTEEPITREQEVGPTDAGSRYHGAVHRVATARQQKVPLVRVFSLHAG